jgi:N-acylglucosamine 2-epimerase
VIFKTDNYLMDLKMIDFTNLSLQYKNELLNNVIPFWIDQSQDKAYGGYFTCLDRQGNVFDTDKFIWLQGRQVWMFSMLYNNVEQRSEWLECAIQGGEFLKKHGHDGDLNWYFSLTREGEPIIEPYNIFSYTFATMAFGQLSKATGNQEYADIAKRTFDIILSKRDNPKGKWNKAFPGTRNLKSFALPMILCNLSLEIEHLLDREFLEKTMEECIHEVMEVFLRPELGGLIVENVNENGSLSDTFDGRLMNPGHAIEAMWFIMDLGKRLNRPELIEKAVATTLKTIEYGWDKKYGGIFYFMDRNGCPPQQLEWDQKLWWVHIETLISLIKGYQLTGSTECMNWFTKIHEYTWSHFKDAEYPEWWGYLNRQGEVLLDLKGGKWKGCFHVPRGLYQCWRMLESLEAQQTVTAVNSSQYIG